MDAGKDGARDLARQFFGRETVLEIETLAPETADPAQNHNNGNGPDGRAAKNHRLQEIRREALSHPLVLKVLDVFPRAEVRDVRLREVPAPAAAGIRFPPEGGGGSAADRSRAAVPPEEMSEDEKVRTLPS